MPQHPRERAQKYIAHLAILNLTRDKMEYLYSINQIGIRDIEQVYRGLFLDASFSLDILIEDVFLGLLSGKYTIKSVRPKVMFSSNRGPKQVIFESNHYFNWLDQKRILKKARIYFSRGKPFSNWKDIDKYYLSKVQCLRNHLAHKSDYSKKKYEKTVLGSTPYRIRERKPAAFLRVIYQTNPNQTRYEEYTTGMSDIADRITSS